MTHPKLLYLTSKVFLCQPSNLGAGPLRPEMVPRPPPTDYVIANYVLQTSDPRGLLVYMKNEMSKQFTYDVHRTIHFIFYS